VSGGFSKDGLAAVTAQLEPFVAAEESVGLVTLLYRKGEIAQVNTLGWQDREAKVPMARDTIFRMASMTKPIASVAAMILVEEGKLKLTDSVEKWLPELANRRVLISPEAKLNDTEPALRPITVLDLLTHRSGIAYNFTSDGPLAQAIADKLGDPLNPQLRPDAWIKELGKLPLIYQPGYRWHYGLSTDVLGVLIERVSGMPFPDFLAQRIFTPLGMKDTGFHVAPEKASRVATVYGFDANMKRIRDPLEPRTVAPPFCSGGGGSVSTADDYLKFGRMLLNGGKLGDTRILSKRAVTLMTSDFLTPEQRQVPFFGMDFWGGQGFGLGLSVVDNVAKHSFGGVASKGTFSWGGAYGTWWQADPVEDMIAIYLVQNASNLLAVTAQMMETMASRRGAATSVFAFQTAAYRAIDD
jgi:CubicO group peptidase (beta-lactamase class C family)